MTPHFMSRVLTDYYYIDPMTGAERMVIYYSASVEVTDSGLKPKHRFKLKHPCNFTMRIKRR